MIGNHCCEKDHLHHNREAEYEILNEMDEGKKRFDEGLEAMEQQAQQYGEDQNESTQLLPFS